MTAIPRPDPRTFGAALAFALDLILLLIAAALVLASFSLAYGIALTAAFGVVIAPVLGWRYGRLAARARQAAWVPDALRTVFVIGMAFVIGWVILQTVFVPTTGGLVGKVLLAVYAFIIDSIAVLTLAFVVSVALGVPWTAGMKWFARRRGQI